MSYLSDDDNDNNNNHSGVNVQDELVANPTDKPSTDKKTRDKIISSKINRFAKGFKIPSDKKRKSPKNFKVQIIKLKFFAVFLLLLYPVPSFIPSFFFLFPHSVYLK
jgi:hypothetical protein